MLDVETAHQRPPNPVAAATQRTLDMPLTTISLRTGTTPAYRRAIADSVHHAMIHALGIPADDRFVLVLEHAPENMIHDRVFFGVERSDRSVFVQIVINHR